MKILRKVMVMFVMKNYSKIYFSLELRVGRKNGKRKLGIVTRDWDQDFQKKNIPKIGQSNKVKSFLFFLYVSYFLCRKLH